MNTDGLREIEATAPEGQASRTRSPRLRPVVVLAVASTGAFLPFLDGTMVNVALPSIAADFPGISIGWLYLIYNAYAITFAAFMPAFGRLGDRVGRRRLFSIGTVLFTLAAVTCGVVDPLPVLLAARAVQGLGAAMMVPASMTMVIEAFPHPSRGTTLAVWGAVPMLAVLVGLLLGGALVEFGSWRLVFLVSVPFAVAAVLLVRVYTVETRAFDLRRLADLGAATLLAGMLTAWFLGVLAGQDRGWADPRTIVAFLAVAACAGGLVQRLLRHPRPLIDRALFRNPTFTVSAVVSLLAGMGFYPYAFVFVLWLRQVWGYGPLAAGLAMAPAAVVAIAIVPPLARLGAARGYRPIIVAGAAVWCVAFLWYATRVGTTPAFLSEWFPGQVLSGVGAGATLGLIATVALGAAPLSGSAPAANFAIRQVGGVVGAGAVIALMGTPTPETLPDALRLGYLWSAGCFAAAAAVAVGLRRPAPTAEEPDLDATLAPPMMEVPAAPEAPAGRGPARVVAVLGIGADAPVAEVAEAIAGHLRRSLRTMVAAGLTPEGLERASRDHDRVLLTEPQPGQGGRTVLVARSEADPAVVVIPQAARPVDLVLVGARPTTDAVAAWADRVGPERLIVAAERNLASALQSLAAALGGTALGLVLGGGGARALSHVGLLAELESAGVRIDRVAGTSMGAIVAGAYATGMPVAEIEENLYRDVVRRNPIGDYTMPTRSLAKGTRMVTMLRHHMGATTRIEETQRLFRCVSVDLLARTRVVHRSGLLWEAVVASSRLPIILPPFRLGDRLLLDGGLLDNLPVDLLADTGEGPVIAVPIGAGGGTGRIGGAPPMPTLGETLIRSMMIGSGGTLDRARAAGALHIVSPAVNGVGLAEFHLMDRMVEAGRVAARTLLEETGGDFSSAN